MGALVETFGVPRSWRRVVPAAAGTALLGLVFGLGAAVPAAANSEAGAADAAGDGEARTAPDAVTAATIARLAGEPVEVMGERTELGSVFALADGTYAAGQATGPVWVRRGGDGLAVEDWAPVDLTLEVGEDGLVRPVAQTAGLVLSGGTDPAPQAEDGAAERAKAMLTTPVEESPTVPGGASSEAPAPVQSSDSSGAPAAPSAPSAPVPSPAPSASEPSGSTADEAAPDAAVNTTPADAPKVEIASVTDPGTGLVTRLQWEGTLPAPRLEGPRAV